MKLISNTSYIITNNEIQLIKKYNFILIINMISLHITTISYVSEKKHNGFISYSYSNYIL